MPEALKGSCLCGAIQFTVSQPVTELRACHCRDCQRVSGTGASIGAPVPKAAFRITQGKPKRYTRTSSSGRILHRYFCGDCGSPLYSEREISPEIVNVRAGSLDESADLKIVFNIWTASARPWDYIDPAVKQHPGQPDAPPK